MTKEKEFNLSEKRIFHTNLEEFCFKEEDVKEFIKRLKGKINYVFSGTDLTGYQAEILKGINKLAGEDLK